MTDPLRAQQAVLLVRPAPRSYRLSKLADPLRHGQLRPWTVRPPRPGRSPSPTPPRPQASASGGGHLPLLGTSSPDGPSPVKASLRFLPVLLVSNSKNHRQDPIKEPLWSEFFFFPRNSILSSLTFKSLIHSELTSVDGAKGPVSPAPLTEETVLSPLCILGTQRSTG